jgi:hypothetical protein
LADILVPNVDKSSVSTKYSRIFTEVTDAGLPISKDTTTDDLVHEKDIQGPEGSFPASFGVQRKQGKISQSWSNGQLYHPHQIPLTPGGIIKDERFIFRSWIGFTKPKLLLVT